MKGQAKSKGAAIDATTIGSGTLPVLADGLKTGPGIFYANVTGDSMIGFDIREDDFLRMDQTKAIRSGDFVWVGQLGTQPVVKRYWNLSSGGVELEPGNPRYQTTIIPDPRSSGLVFIKVMGRLPIPRGTLTRKGLKIVQRNIMVPMRASEAAALKPKPHSIVKGFVSIPCIGEAR